MEEKPEEGPLEIFKEALFEDNLSLQIEAVNKTENIAKIIGEKSTREELLPFLKDVLIELHEEVLLNLCVQLRQFVPLVGGLEHSTILFDILTTLCRTDEVVIRDAAIDTLVYLGKDLNGEQVKEFIWPVLSDLEGDSWFTSKCSTIALYPIFYPKLNEADKAVLRHNFKIFIQEDSPMVRRGAALAFEDFISVVEDEFVRHEFVPMFCDIALDPMEAIKCISIDIAIALAKRLGESPLNESIFKTIEAASDLQSWKMRQHLANNISEFQRCIPYPIYRGKILALFQKLAQDIDATVRTIMAKNISKYCKNLLESYTVHPHQENNFEAIFKQSIMPTIDKLAIDEYEDVRLALSSNIFEICSILSEDCINETMLPFLQKILMPDESIGILANYLQGLNYVSSKIDLSKSLNSISTVIKTVLTLSQSNWRSRRGILTTFIDISNFCKPDYFSSELKIYFATLLGDQVFAVRRSATLIVPFLAKRYGIKWSREHLVPYVISFYQDKKYLYRFVPLFGISEMIKPFLCESPESYLNDFKKIIEDNDNINNKKALISLARIVKTSKVIENNLEKEKYSKLLSFTDELDYVSSSDPKIYSETAFSELQEKYKKENVYSVEPIDFENDHQPYLEGILFFIHEKFLSVLEILSKDDMDNIAVRAVVTLGEVQDFIAKVNKECKEPWVENSLKQLTAEELLNIDNELKSELQTKVPELEEVLDTTLADNNDTEVDLSKSICIDNSAITKDSETIVNSESVSSNIQPESTILDVVNLNKEDIRTSEDNPNKEIPESSNLKEDGKRTENVEPAGSNIEKSKISEEANVNVEENVKIIKSPDDTSNKEISESPNLKEDVVQDKTDECK